MIAKENFVTLVEALDIFWNEKNSHLEALGIGDNYFHDFADIVMDVLEKEIDPQNTAKNDEYVHDCGAYICDWLFSSSKLREQCKTAAELYVYILSK